MTGTSLSTTTRRQADRVRIAIAETLGLPEDRITPETRLEEDLGLDSLDLARVVMAIERDLDFPISDRAAQAAITVADLERILPEPTSLSPGNA